MGIVYGWCKQYRRCKWYGYSIGGVGSIIGVGGIGIAWVL